MAEVSQASCRPETVWPRTPVHNVHQIGPADAYFACSHHLAATLQCNNMTWIDQLPLVGRDATLAGHLDVQDVMGLHIHSWMCRQAKGTPSRFPAASAIRSWVTDIGALFNRALGAQVITTAPSRWYFRPPRWRRCHLQCAFLGLSEIVEPGLQVIIKAATAAACIASARTLAHGLCMLPCSFGSSLLWMLLNPSAS